MEEAILTLDEAVAYLKVPKSTLYKLLEAGRIPARKIGRRWRFTRVDLEAWMRSSHDGVSEDQVAGAGRGPAVDGGKGVISDLLREERTFLEVVPSSFQQAALPVEADA